MNQKNIGEIMKPRLIHFTDSMWNDLQESAKATRSAIQKPVSVADIVRLACETLLKKG